MAFSTTRVISDKKLKKNETLHVNKIPGLIKRYEAQLTDDLNHNVILVGDSKVRHIDLEMTAQTNLTNFWRKGAEVENTQLLPHIHRHIQRHSKPIVLLWFNTCHLTKFDNNDRKFINLVDNFDDIVNITINKYTALKQRLIYRKSTAIVLFLECPFFSITEWNGRRGHRDPESFNYNQEKLENTIYELNLKIQELNAPHKPPLVAHDMIFRIKKRPHHEQTKKISYTVLKDGIHPDRPVSKLWLIRLNNFVTRLNNA